MNVIIKWFTGVVTFINGMASAVETVFRIQAGLHKVVKTRCRLYLLAVVFYEENNTWAE